MSYRVSTRRLILPTVLLLAGLPHRPLVAQATTDSLPSARDVLQRYIQAVGGEQVIRDQPARRIRGTVEVPAQGISGTLVVYGAPPDRLSARTEIAGIGAILNGYDGKTGWSIHPAYGPTVLEGRMLQQMRQQADFFEVLHPEQYVDTMVTMERTDFDSKPAYRIRNVTHDGEEYSEFYDVESGLLRGVIRKEASPMGDIETTTSVTDYKPFAGMLVPTRIIQNAMGMETVVAITEITPWTAQDSVFTPPPEIRAIMKK